MPPPPNNGNLDLTQQVRLTVGGDGFRATLPVEHARHLERFQSESAIATACFRYLCGWVMREFEPCSNPTTLSFCHDLVHQCLLYGLATIDMNHKPIRVVPVPSVEIEVLHDQTAGKTDFLAYLRYAETMSRSMTDELSHPMTVVILNTPNVERLRFSPPLGSALSLHATVRVTRLMQTQIHHRNATRQNFFVRPTGEDAFLRQRTAGHEALARAIWSPMESLRMDQHETGQVFSAVEDLQRAAGQRTAKRVNQQQQMLGGAFDVMQCTTLAADLPRFGDFNALAPLDANTVLAALPTTPFAPGTESLADRHEQQVCACLGLGIDEVRGTPVGRLGNYARHLVVHLASLLEHLNPPDLRRLDAKAGNGGVANVALETPRDILAAVSIGLISYEVGRKLLGQPANAGLPTPPMDRLPGMKPPAAGPGANSSSGSKAPPAKRVKAPGDEASAKTA